MRWGSGWVAQAPSLFKIWYYIFLAFLLRAFPSVGGEERRGRGKGVFAVLGEQGHGAKVAYLLSIFLFLLLCISVAVPLIRAV